ncbi:DUF397 domain-containing protein [Streptomyces sp. KE1]|uniref:DUF397 domain-containing protein n=1 Tax=Streptomyces sp. KE1 TaxID=1638939 RepID=UPI00063EA7C3|nr:DUF397 domain-containing protein [Streptomyces sp. KE1]KLJ01802.1 hypothetical protein WQ59_12500 [Streptomyces sp. KE1]
MRIGLDWRTSSYTKSDNCVEVADDPPSFVLVRDTKDREAGFLPLRQAAWAEFVRYVKRQNS